MGSGGVRSFNKREFVVNINSDYLTLNIGKLRTSDDDPQDYWVPKRLFRRSSQ